MEQENNFYRQESDGSLTLIKTETVILPSPIEDKEAELLKLYAELEALKAQQNQ